MKACYTKNELVIFLCVEVNFKNILISRTDSIGDVVLTLPITVWLKEQFPTAKLTFLCKKYTQPIVKSFASVDETLDVDDLLQNQNKAIETLKQFDVIIHVFPNKDVARLAKKAGVKWRIGTSHRFFHWFTCNKKVSFTRKNSDLHESQLNFNLLKPLGLKEIPSFLTIQEMVNQYQPTEKELPAILHGIDLNQSIILHPKSKGSAQEWPLTKYNELAKELVKEGFQVLFTGTEEEGKLFRNEIEWQQNTVDVSGKLTLEQLQWLIKSCHALVACSTGPYHIAGISGIKAVGLFAAIRPIHPGRWRALGSKSSAIIYGNDCETCDKNRSCEMVSKISVYKVLNAVKSEN